MGISFVNHKAKILIKEYPRADSLKKEVLSLLTFTPHIPKDNTNVKAFHTDWDWHPDNVIFNNFKTFIINEIEKEYGRLSYISDHGLSKTYKCADFWVNVYSKGEYAVPHAHDPSVYSFAYFLNSKWYDSPLIFSDSGKKIRPKEGKFVVFPSYLKHHVPKHRYDHNRITVSGNFKVSE